MGAIKNSIKIIEKTEQEIDALKPIIDELGLSDEDKAKFIDDSLEITFYLRLYCERFCKQKET